MKFRFGPVGLICSTVLLLLAAELASCGYNAEEALENRRKEEDRISVSHFRTVEYNGHNYILYREYHGPNHTFSGLTHDPECGCEEIEYYGCDVVKFCSCEEDDIIQ